MNEMITENNTQTLNSRFNELVERRQRLEKTIEYQKELQELSNEEFKFASEFFGICADRNIMLSSAGKARLKQLLNEFSFSNVVEAMETAVNKYYKGDDESLDKAFDMIGGICNNRKHQRKESYYFNYMRKVCYDNFKYYNEKYLRIFSKSIETDDNFEAVKEMLSMSYSWTQFRNAFCEYFYEK